MMHGREKSDLVIVAMNPATKRRKPAAEASRGRSQRCRWSEGRDQGEYAPAQHVPGPEPARVTHALGRIRPLRRHTPEAGSRLRESRTYGSVRGACDEMHVPTATSGASSSPCSAARRLLGRSPCTRSRQRCR